MIGYFRFLTSFLEGGWGCCFWGLLTGRRSACGLTWRCWKWVWGMGIAVFGRFFERICILTCLCLLIWVPFMLLVASNVFRTIRPEVCTHFILISCFFQCCQGSLQVSSDCACQQKCTDSPVTFTMTEGSQSWSEINTFPASSEKLLTFFLPELFFSFCR